MQVLLVPIDYLKSLGTFVKLGGNALTKYDL